MEYVKAREAAEYIKHRINDVVEIGVICGSGLGAFADKISEPTVINTTEIPHFKASTVAGHAGQIVIGRICGKSILAVKGRLHVYEGHSIHDTVRVVRVMSLLGVKKMIITNAAGGINQSFKVGDLMVISDHINLPGMTGVNPLRGPNEDQFGGPRFLPTNDIYSHELRHKFFEIADNHQLSRAVYEGVYTMLTGPTYESSAEVRLIQLIGGDAVGMSSVPEAIIASHCGIQVFGLSLITNVAISTPPLSGRAAPTTEKTELPNHEEVVTAANKAAEDIEMLISEFIKSL